MSSFKSCENIQKKEGWPDRSVSDNQSSSVTLNELAMKTRQIYCNLEFQQGSLEFWILEEEGLYYLCSENKGFVFAYAISRYSHDADHI